MDTLDKVDMLDRADVLDRVDLPDWEDVSEDWLEMEDVSDRVDESLNGSNLSEDMVDLLEMEDVSDKDPHWEFFHRSMGTEIVYQLVDEFWGKIKHVRLVKIKAANEYNRRILNAYQI